jgi:hypothetical protein
VTKPSLAELEGKTVGMMVPAFNRSNTTRVIIHSVEPYGIWVESQEVTTNMLTVIGATMSGTTPVFFLPYSSISYVVSQIQSPSMSDSMLNQ